MRHSAALVLVALFARPVRSAVRSAEDGTCVEQDGSCAEQEEGSLMQLKKHQDSDCSTYEGWNNNGHNIQQDGHDEWLSAYGISCFQDLGSCLQCCSKTSNCIGWTWTSNQCYLKDQVDNCVEASGYNWAASGFCNPASPEGHSVTCGDSPSPSPPSPAPSPSSGCGQTFGGKNNGGTNIDSHHGDGFWPSYQGTPCSNAQGDCQKCCELYGDSCKGWTWVNAPTDGYNGKCYLKSAPNSYCTTDDGSSGSWVSSGFCHPADWATC